MTIFSVSSRRDSSVDETCADVAGSAGDQVAHARHPRRQRHRVTRPRISQLPARISATLTARAQSSLRDRGRSPTVPPCSRCQPEVGGPDRSTIVVSVSAAPSRSRRIRRKASSSAVSCARHTKLIVGCAAEVQELDHGREARGRGGELVRIGGRAERHADERLEAPAACAGIHDRSEAGDDTGTPKPPHAVRRRIRTEPYGCAEITPGDPAVLTQHPEDLAVDFVHRPDSLSPWTRRPR